MITLDGNGYLLTRIGTLSVAIPLNVVQAVSEPVLVTPLPLSPDFVDGLVFVHDRVLPQINMRAVLEQPSASEGAASGPLVIVAFGDDVRALHVDQVLAITAAEPGSVSSSPDPVNGTNCLSSGFTLNGAIWRILDPTRFRLQVTIEARSSQAGAALLPLDDRRPAPFVDEDINSVAHQSAFVIATIDGDTYAFATEDIVELLVPQGTRFVPGAPDFIAGLIDRRSQPVLALDTALLLGRARKTPPDSGVALLVAMHHEPVVALMVDRVLGISRIDDAQLYALSEPMAGISRYTVTDRGTIIGIVAPAALTVGVVQDIACFMPRRSADATPLATAAIDDKPMQSRKMLSMRLGSNFYCLDLHRVDRILIDMKLTPLANLGNGFDGLADAGDQVIPVLDLRRAFAHSPPDDSPPCILLHLEGAAAGLAVDQVLRIEDVEESEIEPVSDRPELPIHAVARVNGRLMGVLTVDRLLPARID